MYRKYSDLVYNINESDDITQFSSDFESESEDNNNQSEVSFDFTDSQSESSFDIHFIKGTLLLINVYLLDQNR